MTPKALPQGASRFGIRTRLVAVNSVVIVTSFVTAILVAAAVGPPMFQRLMDSATQPGAMNDHPYQRAFEKSTAVSLGTALVVSVVAALALSWYLSRRVYRSATELAHAATVIADGHYDFRVSPPRLGREFDEIAVAFNTMAASLGRVEHGRRQMLADLAHEMRTPVAIVEAYLEALEDGVKALDADAVAVLRDQSRRLTRLSKDVAALSDAEHQARTIDARWTSLTRLVTTATAVWEPRYRAKGVLLASTAPADLPDVWADPERLGQVLANLLDNGLRHTRSGGSVTVGATATDREVTVEVSDTGDGIPSEHLPHLFDRFYRVDDARDRVHGGAGIGLAIAKALVDGHGGTIRADSPGLGEGATFTVSLPRGVGHGPSAVASHQDSTHLVG
ncbi:HAMP domain-containing sensor histidine kinase [Mycobacterium sp. NPDC006124]|uniref:sensor histidine kinase n=1 Tax=Mycobacterium sp. NPDC006124 TaxID=3156729 RepID=UPI0033B25925